MADLGEIYDETRRKISDFVRGLDADGLARPLPAAPGWTVRDVISHLSGDLASILASDFPAEFFASIGEPQAVQLVNRWTDTHIASRRSWSLADVLEEWETNSAKVVPMVSGSQPWPEGIPPFAPQVLVTDVTVHQHDIYGAFGDERDRESPGVRLANATYTIGMGWRLAAAGIPSLLVVSGDSERVAGSGDPEVTVRAARFEMFRALSGRRSPGQIASFDWDGDPEPYIPYFYPYGVREEALVE